MRPRSGVVTPAIMRSVMDFPEPEGPSKPDGAAGRLACVRSTEVLQPALHFHLQRASAFEHCGCAGLTNFG